MINGLSCRWSGPLWSKDVIATQFLLATTDCLCILAFVFLTKNTEFFILYIAAVVFDFLLYNGMYQFEGKVRPILLVVLLYLVFFIAAINKIDISE